MIFPSLRVARPLLRLLPSLVVGAGLTLGAAEPAAAQAKPKQEELPPPPVHVWVIAPTPRGPWTLRIDNEGDTPVRIAADVRLLELNVETAEKRPQKVRCVAPDAMRPRSFPERRALILRPGESYIEPFDPHLLCFGKNARVLEGSSVVRAYYGWSAPPKWSRGAPQRPYAFESVEDPPSFAPARGLGAPRIVLSYGRSHRVEEPDEEPVAPQPPAAPPTAPAKPAAPATPPGPPAPTKPTAPTAPVTPAPGAPATPVAGAPPAPEAPPVVDAGAPRLEVSPPQFVDAAAPRAVSVSITATNVGRRSMTVALRPRMVAFEVKGPDGVTTCAPTPPSGAVPRDLFRTLQPKASATLAVLLGEVCPDTALRRSGLYRVTPTLHANEPGTDLGIDAYTAVVPSERPALLRLHTAPEPFHLAPPQAVPTPKPTGEPDED